MSANSPQLSPSDMCFVDNTIGTLYGALLAKKPSGTALENQQLSKLTYGIKECFITTRAIMSITQKLAFLVSSKAGDDRFGVRGFSDATDTMVVLGWISNANDDLTRALLISANAAFNIVPSMSVDEAKEEKSTFIAVRIPALKKTMDAFDRRIATIANHDVFKVCRDADATLITRRILAQLDDFPKI